MRNKEKYEEKTYKRKNDRGKKNNKGMGDSKWSEESSKVRGRSQEISSSRVLQVDLCL